MIDVDLVKRENCLFCYILQRLVQQRQITVIMCGVKQLTFYNNNIHNDFRIGSLKYQTINHVVYENRNLSRIH